MKWTHQVERLFLSQQLEIVTSGNRRSCRESVGAAAVWSWTMCVCVCVCWLNFQDNLNTYSILSMFTVVRTCCSQATSNCWQWGGKTCCNLWQADMVKRGYSSGACTDEPAIPASEHSHCSSPAQYKARIYPGDKPSHELSKKALGQRHCGR